MFDKELKYFPIATDPACLYKWSWSSLYLVEGKTNSCHRTKRYDLDINDFDNFHNLPGKVEDREVMLQGHWPKGKGCEFCKHVEDAGGLSDRLSQKTIPNLSPPELEVNQTAVEVTPRILEVFLNSTCNLMCTYCNPRDSSLIRKENEKFGEIRFRDSRVLAQNMFNRHFPLVSNQPAYMDKFISWLERNGHHLRRLSLLGGETLYQDELDRVLDVLDGLHNPDLELNVFSNLMVNKGRLERVITKIRNLLVARHIGRFDLSASIDCWGPEQEFARYGLKLPVWEENFAYVVDQKWIKLHVNQTITSLTIRTMPELIQRINHYRAHRKITHFFGLVTGRPHMHPQAWAWATWAKDFDRILSVMPGHDQDQQQARERMQGIALQLQQAKHNDWSLINDLQQHLDAFDQRRGTDWRSIFPYLAIKKEDTV